MDVQQLLERALGLADEGDWVGAAEVLRSHLDEFAEEPAIHCWLGVAEQELGLEGVAYERFKRALALEPEDPYVLATAGNAVAAFDDPAAEQALRLAALTAPELPVARLLYGAYLSREGFVEQALEQLAVARELDEDDPQIAYELGVARLLGGDVEGAADSFGDAVALEPRAGWARLVYGLVLLESGRAQEGAGELVEGARMMPEDVEAQLTAALAASVLGADDTAYEMLERARMWAVEGDAVLVSAVEDRLEAGSEASRRLLHEELAPDVLRTRVRQRP